MPRPTHFHARLFAATIATGALVAAGLAMPLAAQAATPVTTGFDLKAKVENVSAAGIYQLTQDIGVSPEPLNDYNSAGSDVTIDLNGHTMNSYYLKAKTGGTLTITDSTSAGGTLNASGYGFFPGLLVPSTSTLRLRGSVHVIAAGAPDQAGIGGSSNGFSDSGTVIISDSAVVNAVAGNASTNGAAGIGGAAQGNGGSVIVEDSAHVTASASVISNNTYSSGAGIGGGSNSYGGTITVTDSAVVTATGGRGAAGIGGGKGQGIESFTISDTANVTANPGSDPSGVTTPADSIGNGANGNGTNHLVLNGGTWTIPNLSQQRFREDTTSSTTIINRGIITNTATNAILTNNAAIQSPLGLVAMPVKNRNYTVFLNTGDGSLGDNSASVDFHARTLSLADATLPVPTRAGYTFTGWKFADNVSGPAVALNTDFTPRGTSLTGAPVEVSLVASYQFIKLASNATVSVSPNSAEYGTQQKVTATFAGGASGPVNYSFDGGSPSLVAQANTGAFDLPTTLAVGTHTLEVTYSGDSSYLPGSASTTFVVTAIPTAMTGVLSAASGVVGTGFTITPTLAGASGPIAISADGVAVGSSASGAAFSLPALQVGSHTIAASFAGDATHAASSVSLSLVVMAAPVVTVPPVEKITPKVTVTGKRFAENHRPVITVKLSALGAVKKATGKVAIYVGKKKVKTVFIKNETVVKVALPKKYSKTITVRAKFLGSATIAAKASKTLKLRVK